MSNVLVVVLTAMLVTFHFTVMVFSGVSTTHNEVFIDPSTVLLPFSSSSNSTTTSRDDVDVGVTFLMSFHGKGAHGGWEFQKPEILMRNGVTRGFPRGNKGATTHPRLELPMDESLLSNSVDDQGSKLFETDSRVVLSAGEFSNTLLSASIIKNILSRTQYDNEDYEGDVDELALSETVFTKYFEEWMCPNFMTTLRQTLKSRWVAAMLRFLPQLLGPVAMPFVLSAGGDRNFTIVLVVGVLVLSVMIFTGSVMELQSTGPRMKQLLSSDESPSDFCDIASSNSGDSERGPYGYGFRLKMRTVAHQINAVLSLILIFFYIGGMIAVYVIMLMKERKKREREKQERVSSSQKIQDAAAGQKSSEPIACCEDVDDSSAKKDDDKGAMELNVLEKS